MVATVVALAEDTSPENAHPHPKDAPLPEDALPDPLIIVEFLRPLGPRYHTSSALRLHPICHLFYLGPLTLSGMQSEDAELCVIIIPAAKTESAAANTSMGSDTVVTHRHHTGIATVVVHA